MTRSDVLTILHGLLSAGRFVNLAIATQSYNASTALIIGAICEGLNVVVQRMSVNTIPDRAHAVLQTVAAEGTVTHPAAAAARELMGKGHDLG